MSTPKLQLEPQPPLKSVSTDLYTIHNVNAFDWMKQQPLNSIQAVVTDPPYGLLEYTEKELVKLKKGRGGVWRIPPAFDGAKRRPLPRFTVLTSKDKTHCDVFSRTLPNPYIRFWSLGRMFSLRPIRLWHISSTHHSSRLDSSLAAK